MTWNRSLAATCLYAVAALAGACAPADEADVETTEVVQGLNPSNGSVVRLQNACSGLVLDVTGASTVDGAAASQWTSWSGANQTWTLRSAAGGAYVLVAQHSGKALDVSGASTASGARVLQWTVNGQRNQQWFFSAVGDGSYRVSPGHALTKNLQPAGASSAAGALMEINAANPASCAQRWKLVAAGATPPPATDTQAPVAPAALAASAVSPTAATLTWGASSDNVGVTGYRIFRNGTQVAQTSALTSVVTGLTCGTSYSLGVSAHDAAGNVSSVSTLPVSTASCPASSGPQPLGVAGTWTLAFSDEFNGASLDLSKWSTVDGWQMNGVTTRASNVAVSGGNLVLTLASSTSGAEICSGSECGAGAGAFHVNVGNYAEARVYFPGSGTTIYNWPAWWISGPSWPSAGEHDIAEGLGQLTVNYHSPSGAHNQGGVPGTWSNAFHVYGVHRKATSADVYWDGVLVKSYRTDDNGQGQSLIFNIGEGSSHVYGAASRMLVDYVRVWK